MTGLIPGNLADRGGTISQGDGDSGGLSFCRRSRRTWTCGWGSFFVGLWLGREQSAVDDARGGKTTAGTKCRTKKKSLAISAPC